MNAADVGTAAELACLLEASAPKPGNVSPGRPFSDLRYEDFLASAVAIGAPMAAAGDRSVGATVRLAIETTCRWAPSNTNLGIVLLLTPLARAAVLGDTVSDPSFRDELRRVLDATTIDDAREVYAAIRRAAPGGLGRVDAQDVAHEPTMTLTAVMQLAADRDQIAREYATAFETTFGEAVPALVRARGEGLQWDDAVVETFLTLLASAPDTHLRRRRGADAAAEVSRRARTVLAEGGVRSAAGQLAIRQMDRDLRDGPQGGNPGATADLTAAALFVVLLREHDSSARAGR